jgi:uncharacterized protein YprB with RNaseH-like and TPR domain
MVSQSHKSQTNKEADMVSQETNKIARPPDAKELTRLLQDADNRLILDIFTQKAVFNEDTVRPFQTGRQMANGDLDHISPPTLAKKVERLRNAGADIAHFPSRKMPVVDADYSSKIAVFDIEHTPGFVATFGRLLCCSFGTLYGSDVLTIRGDDWRFKGKKKTDDSKMAAKIKELLESAWMWASWNGKIHDISYLNGRLMLAGLRPVEKRMHLDLMYYARKPHISLHSARLDAVAKAFKLQEQKTEIDYEVWLRATMLESDAMDVVVEHCEADIKTTRAAFFRLSPLVARIHK